MPLPNIRDYWPGVGLVYSRIDFEDGASLVNLDPDFFLISHNCRLVLLISCGHFCLVIRMSFICKIKIDSTKLTAPWRISGEKSGHTVDHPSVRGSSVSRTSSFEQRCVWRTSYVSSIYGPIYRSIYGPSTRNSCRRRQFAPIPCPWYWPQSSPEFWS